MNETYEQLRVPKMLHGSLRFPSEGKPCHRCRWSGILEERLN